MATTANFAGKIVRGPLDHIINQPPRNISSHILDQTFYDQWATEDDVPDIAGVGTGVTATNNFHESKFWVSKELRDRAAQGEVGDTIQVDGQLLDTDLFDLFSCATKDLDGNIKKIQGQQAEMLVKCVRDGVTFRPTEAEQEVFEYALKTFKMNSEARRIFTLALRQGKNQSEKPALGSGGVARSLTTPNIPNTTTSHLLPDASNESDAATPGSELSDIANARADEEFMAAARKDSLPYRLSATEKSLGEGLRGALGGDVGNGGDEVDDDGGEAQYLLARLQARIEAADINGDTSAMVVALRTLADTPFPPGDAGPPSSLIRIIKRLRSFHDDGVASAAAVTYDRWRERLRGSRHRRSAAAAGNHTNTSGDDSGSDGAIGGDQRPDGRRRRSSSKQEEEEEEGRVRASRKRGRRPR